MTFGCRFLSVLILLAMLFGAMPSALAATPEDYDSDNPEVLEPDHLYAESALLMDMDTGEILLSKNSRVRMYPASTTKIMTMILAVESGIPLDQQVTIPKEADDVPEGSSVIGIKSKDVMTWGDLLYGFMLRSGNDGSNAIAVLTAGSIDAFVQRMNMKVMELGCEGTHYVNAHGYHTEDHYTTAQDLAKMSIYAMKNPVFRQVVATGKTEITITRGGKTKTSEIENRNSLVVSDSKYYYPGANGIKTGHHNKAGRCVVASAEREGINLIAVVMNCATEEKQFDDAKKLFNYGFCQYAQYSMAELLTQLQPEIATVEIENAAENDPAGGTMQLRFGEITGGDITRMIQRNSARAMELALGQVREGLTVNWNRELVAPVTAGETMGEVCFTAPDGSQVSTTLIATRNIEAKPEPTPSPTPTRAPTEAPAATQAGEERVEDEQQPPRDNGGMIRALAIFIAVALLLAAVLMIHVHMQNERRRKAARRRARRRRAMASRGVQKGREKDKKRPSGAAKAKQGKTASHSRRDS